MKRGVTGDVGHYTQIAWADTNKVGCGFIMYEKGSWFKKVTYTYNFDKTLIHLKLYFNI